MHSFNRERKTYLKYPKMSSSNTTIGEFDSRTLIKFVCLMLFTVIIVHACNILHTYLWNGICNSLVADYIKRPAFAVMKYEIVIKV